MLRDENLVSLDQLNKDLKNFHSLYEWMENNSDAKPVVSRYATINAAVNTALEQVVEEIRHTQDLPSAADPDRQALEQLVILLESSLSEEQQVVMENHLFDAVGKISVSLKETPLDTCDEQTRACLKSLDRMLEEFRPH